MVPGRLVRLLKSDKKVVIFIWSHVLKLQPINENTQTYACKWVKTTQIAIKSSEPKPKIKRASSRSSLLVVSDEIIKMSPKRWKCVLFVAPTEPERNEFLVWLSLCFGKWFQHGLRFVYELNLMRSLSIMRAALAWAWFSSLFSQSLSTCEHPGFCEYSCISKVSRDLKCMIVVGRTRTTEGFACHASLS